MADPVTAITTGAKILGSAAAAKAAFDPETGSTTTEMDPRMVAMYEDLYGTSKQIAKQPFVPYTGKRVTGFAEYPQLKALNMVFCGGDYKELENMLPSIEKFARLSNCKRLYGGGRTGWLRKIKHLGFQDACLIKKDL